jgi:hypothetical protein
MLLYVCFFMGTNLFQKKMTAANVSVANLLAKMTPAQAKELRKQLQATEEDEEKEDSGSSLEQDQEEASKRKKKSKRQKKRGRPGKKKKLTLKEEQEARRAKKSASDALEWQKTLMDISAAVEELDSGLLTADSLDFSVHHSREGAAKGTGGNFPTCYCYIDH